MVMHSTVRIALMGEWQTSYIFISIFRSYPTTYMNALAFYTHQHGGYKFRFEVNIEGDYIVDHDGDRCM